jgi:hypothetical protein
MGTGIIRSHNHCNFLVSDIFAAMAGLLPGIDVPEK